MGKDSFWFRHDSNARNDVKLVKLRRLAGLEGVGLFWCVIEMLREAKSYELPISSIEDICYDMRVEESVFEAMFESGLLSKGDNFFYSNSLLSRMNTYDEVKEKRRLAGAKGGKAKANAKQVLANAKAKPKQSLANRVELNRVEENIKENIKEKNKKQPTPKTLKELMGEFSNDYPKQMLNEFWSYWTETNTKGKEKWQMERTWGTKRRLDRWKNNNFNGNGKTETVALPTKTGTGVFA